MNREEFIGKITRDLKEKGYLVNEIDDSLEITSIFNGITNQLAFTKDFLFQIYDGNTYKLTLSAVMEALKK